MPSTPRRPDDDDRPPRRPARRNDDDADEDRPRKKNSGVGLVLGILGGVMLLGCGACGGVGYYLYQKGKQVKNKLDEAVAAANADGIRNEQVTAANAERLREGMTQAEVEAILGSGEKMNPATFAAMTIDIGDATQRHINQEHREYWTPWVTKGLVWRWRDGPSYILVAYNDPPDRGGKLKGLSYSLPNAVGGRTSQAHNERIKLPRNPAADDDAVRLGIAPKGGGPGAVARPDPKPAGPSGAGKDNPIKVTAADFLANAKKYAMKWVALTGTVAEISVSPNGSGSYYLAAAADGDKRVQCVFKPAAFGPALQAARGDTYEITGQFFPTGDVPQLTDCAGGSVVRLTPAVPSSAFAAAYARNTADGDARFKGKTFRVSGVVTDLSIGGDANGVILRGIAESPKTKRPPIKVAAHLAGPNWKTRLDGVKVGDTVILSATVDYFADGVVHLKDCYVLSK
jgi:hypothetical protein